MSNPVPMKVIKIPFEARIGEAIQSPIKDSNLTLKEAIDKSLKQSLKKDMVGKFQLILNAISEGEIFSSSVGGISKETGLSKNIVYEYLEAILLIQNYSKVESLTSKIGKRMLTGYRRRKL